MYCILKKDISKKMSSHSLFMAFTHSYTDNKNVQILALFHTISGPQHFYIGGILQ